MVKIRTIASLFLIPFACAISSCSSPRSVLTSGKVLPKNQVRFGRNTTFNVSSAPIERSIRGAYSLAETLSEKDTVIFTKEIGDLNSAIMAYCLDPIGYNTETFFRYGLGNRMDIGFKNTGGANAADFMYQFLGSNKTCNQSDVGGMYGSIGVQYSWQNYKFVNFPKFDKVQKLFGFEMSRKDISIPLVFSKSFGPEERVGCFSFGLVYSHSFINYKISPKNIYAEYAMENVPAELLRPVSGKTHFNSYGTFINMKIGKKYIFFNLSLAAYYQDYGKYPMLGGSTVSLKGISIVPSYGVQFNIFGRKKRTAETAI
ncbi:MAG TPA: hypothetical protein VGC65_02820 [Bacteroidia bacterium]|jgi:hypothetical protein